MIYLTFLLLFSSPPSYLVQKWSKIKTSNNCGLTLFYYKRLNRYNHQFNKSEIKIIEKCTKKLFPQKLSLIFNNHSENKTKFPKNYLKYKRIFSIIPSGSYYIGWIPSLRLLSKKLYKQLKIKEFTKYNDFKFGKWVKYKSFKININEISTGEYKGKTKTNNAQNMVSFSEAQDFCKKVGGNLPDENQWEIASRGGHYYRAWGWGESIPINCYGLNGAKCNLKKQELDISPWGVKKMSSSVAEWVIPTKENPVPKGMAVVKGGTSSDQYFWNLTASRKVLSKKTKSKKIGFRCVFKTKFSK
jgi:Sulfatase-modifying factor enzyme 1